MVAEPVIVTHALGSYPVHIEVGALSRLRALIHETLPERRIAMVSDEVVQALYKAGRFGTPPWTGETFTFAPGEKSKTRETWARLTDALMERGFGRDSGLIALGGGVTGDLAGFVAATYMRGIPYLQVPTTVLAMLDASVGGKTAVDTPQGKNLVGAFHPPIAVIADPQVLLTLPDRDYRAGLAEAVKHGLIADRDYFTWIESSAPALVSRNIKVLTRLIRRSIEIKGEIVADDERESGRRAILNAGHTVAHALEQASGYQLPHGEAVALGLIVECRLEEQMGIAAAGLCSRLTRVLVSLGMPVHLPSPTKPGTLISGMARDKKNQEGHIHFALPVALGRMHRANGWTTTAPAEDVRTALLAIE